MKKQAGASGWALLVFLVLLFSALIIVMRLLPIYSDNWAVETVFENLKNEYQENEYTRGEIWDRIQQRFRLNDIDNLLDDVELTGKGSVIIIQMEYERRAPLVGNMELVAKFTHNVEVSE